MSRTGVRISQEARDTDERRVVAVFVEVLFSRSNSLSVEQKRELKQTTLSRAGDIEGRFYWMKQDILAIIGGDYYYENPILIQVRADPLVWFNRDEQHNLLLNLDTPDTSGAQRVSLRDNDWIVRGDPTDVESPPAGKRLRIEYADGDRLVIKFHEWQTEDDLSRWHPAVRGHDFSYPLTNGRDVPAPARVRY